MIFKPGSAVAVAPQLLAGEAFVDLAGALPGNDLHLCLRRDISRKVLVGNEEHARRAEAFDHLHRVRRGAANVALGFHRRARVHIGDDRHARIGGAERADILGGDG